MTNTSKARYDKIGIGYDNTRKADPYLGQRMFHYLKSGDASNTFLDVGCGTGNYTNALQKQGLRFHGIDPSEEMLSKAKEKNKSIVWKKGTAENIPFDGNSFNGALTTLTMHHWTDLQNGFKEINRVLKTGSVIVLFTTFPEQTKAYWLNHYFPKMMEDSIAILPTRDSIYHGLSATGFQVLNEELYFVKPDLQDWFLFCGKHDPTMYFREDVQNGISSFSLLANQPEIEAGLSKLKSDIESNRIYKVIQDHENELGDYAFIVAKKL
jgi:ubiquinone/menaquinone biosynthesis C-methylase UbiE